MLLASAIVPIYKCLPIITMVTTSTNTTINCHMTTKFFRKLNMVTLFEALADGTTTLNDIRNAKLYFKIQAPEQISSTKMKMDKTEVNQWFDMQCSVRGSFQLQALPCTTTTIGSQLIKRIQVCMMLAESCWQKVLH
jgi:hypothetical protein